MKINDTEWQRLEAEFLMRERAWEVKKKPMSLAAFVFWLAYLAGALGTFLYVITR